MILFSNDNNPHPQHLLIYSHHTLIELRLLQYQEFFSIVTSVAKCSGRTNKKHIVGNALKHQDSPTSHYDIIVIPYI